MKRCKNCNNKFTPRFKTTERYCWEVDCKVAESMVFIEKQRDAKRKKQNKEKAEKKITVYAREYKSNLQNQINLLARKIDAYFCYNCIDCGKSYGKQVDAAHKNNVGGHENIRWNLHNIHSARAFCNQRSSEHKTGYSIGLEERYGIAYKDYVEIEINKIYSYVGLTPKEVVEALKIVRKLNREFDNHISQFKDGSEAREYFNKIIGIYK